MCVCGSVLLYSSVSCILRLWCIHSFLHCQELSISDAEDVGAISRKALNDLDDKMIEALVTQGTATRCALTPSDVLYVPPFSAVWERTQDVPCAYTSFKWLSSPTTAFSNRINRLTTLPGWSATESLTKSLQTLQSMQTLWEKAATAAASEAKSTEVGAQRCVTCRCTHVVMHVRSLSPSTSQAATTAKK